MGLLDRLKIALGRADRMERRLNELEELRPLTAQFYVTLKTAAERLNTDALRDKDAGRLGDFVRRDPEHRTWIEAYEMEQLLVYLYDDATLRTEIGCRLLEAKSVLRPALSGWYAEQAGRAQTAEQQRPLLARLTNDLQWRYTVNELKRQYAKVVTRKTGIVFLAALIVFIIAIPLAWDGDHLMVLAGTAGLWGASFSLLGGLKSRLDAAELDDLKMMRYYGAILTRALVGAGGALIMYFFLRAGLLAGSAFPKLPDGATRPSGDTIALLVVWCFIAGFSEKLVPSLLARTESRADEHVAPSAPSPLANVPAGPFLSPVESDATPARTTTPTTLPAPAAT